VLGLAALVATCSRLVLVKGVGCSLAGVEGLPQLSTSPSRV
jgi:hypothetical protein